MVVRSLLLFCVLASAAAPASYKESIMLWRQTREAGLKADDGWLTVAGLFWLEEGANRAGASDENPVRLPDGAPKVFGVFERAGSRVFFSPAAGVRTLHNGKPVAEGSKVAMGSDEHEATPDLLTFADRYTFFVIERGGRLGVRMRDKQSQMRREFTGLHWYPVKSEYRVEARWVAYDKPKTIPIPNILNQVEQQPSMGYAVFTLAGKEYTLEPVIEGKELFYIFKDLTAGKDTYPAGRFLYTAMPVNGKVILDFNQAYNPPCAFTPYATCPLPPKQNRLQTRIEAGELSYGHH